MNEGIIKKELSDINNNNNNNNNNNKFRILLSHRPKIFDLYVDNNMYVTYTRLIYINLKYYRNEAGKLPPFQYFTYLES
jgi:hypothetical protein